MKCVFLHRRQGLAPAVFLSGIFGRSKPLPYNQAAQQVESSRGIPRILFDDIRVRAPCNKNVKINFNKPLTRGHISDNIILYKQKKDTGALYISTYFEDSQIVIQNMERVRCRSFTLCVWVRLGIL